ncbi:hypothetical protein G9A89_011772 [Geosiphon pyriformis]|nr:hypothetical protein G9A89_011772 [Geosiphon pyriformis]
MALLASFFYVSLKVISESLVSNLDINMALDSVLMLSAPSLSAVDSAVADLSSNSFRVLTSKMGGLKLKIVALEVLVNLVLEKLDCLCSGLDLPALFLS